MELWFSYQLTYHHYTVSTEVAHSGYHGHKLILVQTGNSVET